MVACQRPVGSEMASWRAYHAGAWQTGCSNKQAAGDLGVCGLAQKALGFSGLWSWQEVVKSLSEGHNVVLCCETRHRDSREASVRAPHQQLSDGHGLQQGWSSCQHILILDKLIDEIAQGHPDPDETRSGRILVHQIGSALAGSTDRGEGWARCGRGFRDSRRTIPVPHPVRNPGLMLLSLHQFSAS